MSIIFQYFTGRHGLLAVALILLAACNGGGEPKSPEVTTRGPKLPHMWVDDKTSDEDEGHFTAYLLPPLNTMLGAGQQETDSIYYTLTEFKALIDTCKNLANIAFFDICPAVDPSNNKLTVLYVPEDSGCSPLGYFRLQANSPTFPQAGDRLTATAYQQWQDIYINTVVRKLLPQLDPGDPRNYIDGNQLTPLYNTLHAAHNFSDITELEDEIARQASNKITGIEAMFSAKPAQANGSGVGFSNRLYVMLEFTKDDSAGKHKKFRIDTTGRDIQKPVYPSDSNCVLFETALFSKAIDTSQFVRTSRKSKFLGGNNNGQLCPPACNP